MFRRLRFLRFDAFGNLHCTKCYFWKDCCLPRITRRSKIACSSQFTLRYLDKNSHCTRFNRVSTFCFPIQRFSIPQQYFCSHWLRNLFRVFACINTSKYVITRRSLPNQSMSLFVWCIPRLNSAGLLVRFIPDIVIVKAIEWPCEKMDTKIQAKTQLHMIAIFLSTVSLFWKVWENSELEFALGHP